ncbi:hypothetical protein Q2K19_25735 [Micromonospora soli]|uniref:hypothetical protein n=1 Tax=Micromonospora sp. NBRC 110009 TaxID=3061627 RepID=UPI0026738651|nr:hypothetical protein [Micromonospora sp. NBRC 110009]WKT97549.1 hypothetical protein Q2K19_25735 [Micromonospora sp. NBRC 110009]
MTLIEPVDLLCRTHGALLVFNGVSQRLRYVLGVLACALTWAAFFAAPALNNVIPIFVVLVAAGAAVVALPLRRFPVAGRSIAIGWVIACVLAPVLDRPRGAAFQIVVAVIAIVLALGWALRLGRSAAELNKMADSSGGVAGAALVATLLGVATAAGLLWLATGTARSDPTTHLPAGLAIPLAWTAWLALGFAVVASTGFAAVLGTAGWSDHESWLIEPPREPRRLAGRGAEGRSPGRGVQAMDRFIEVLSRVMVQLILSVLDMLIYLIYYRVLRILVAVVNWILLWLAAISTIGLRAFAVLIRAAWTATRVILIPAVSLLVAAALTLLFAYADVDYVKTGSLADMALLAGYAAASYGLLTLAWTALSAMRAGRLSAAVVDMTGHTLAITTVMVLIGGWGFGILGAVGYGPYHIGWLTLACTGLVVGVMTIRGMRGRSRPAESDDIHYPAPRAPLHDTARGPVITDATLAAGSTATIRAVDSGGDLR